MTKWLALTGFLALLIFSILFALLVPSNIQIIILIATFVPIFIGLTGWAIRQWTKPNVYHYNDKGFAPIIQTGLLQRRFHDLNMTGAIYRPGQELSEVDKLLAMAHLMTRSGGTQPKEALLSLIGNDNRQALATPHDEPENIIEAPSYHYLPDPTESEVFMALAMEDLLE